MNKNKRRWEEYEQDWSGKRMGLDEKPKKKSAPNHIMVQRLSSVANAKKFEALDTRDFVDFTAYSELTTENIKQACEKYYEMPDGSCDVLLGEKGPSCYLTEHLAGKKIYCIRFLDPTTNKCNRKGIAGGDTSDLRPSSLTGPRQMTGNTLRASSASGNLQSFPRSGPNFPPVPS